MRWTKRCIGHQPLLQGTCAGPKTMNKRLVVICNFAILLKTGTFQCLGQYFHLRTPAKMPNSAISPVLGLKITLSARLPSNLAL